MREAPYDAITVTELVAHAQVGRATFYRNFDDIEDILRMRCDQVFDGLMTYIMAYLQQHANEETRTALLKPMLRYFYLHADIIELLLLAKRIDIIQDSFRAKLEPFRAQVAAQQGVVEELADYSIAIRIGIMTNILVHWIENGQQQAPDDLADALGNMLSKTVTLDQLL